MFPAIATSGEPEGIGQPPDDRTSWQTWTNSGACRVLTYRERTFAVCERDVYVEPPSELHRPGLVATLNNTMYETHDASNARGRNCGEHLRSSGFELGASNPAFQSL